MLKVAIPRAIAITITHHCSIRSALSGARESRENITLSLNGAHVVLEEYN
jgi:hypothetical protein